PPHRLVTAIRTHYSPRQQLLEQVTGRLSDFRIVISENSTPTHKEAKHNIQIPNAVNTSVLTLKSNPQPPQNPHFKALMVARIDPRKDHRTMLQALQQLRDELPTGFQITLIGEVTDTATQKQIETIIRRYNLTPVIRQLPATERIEDYYHATDITLLTSNSEGFANVVLESFACGVPIIISEAANTHQLVEHGINGWIFPTGDSQALAKCLRNTWQTSTEQRTQMGYRGRVIAEQYSIQKMVERYQELYDRLSKFS
ncbi:MAG: glycosyltransferase family 4 protein, partial [Chloroflexota bacterium]